MLRTIKSFGLMALLAFGSQTAWGFALLGPLANGGDSYQTATIGYGLAYSESLTPGGPVNLGDIGGPKNLGEGYRRNVPVLYYAEDANWLTFFGSNGVAAVDDAFAVMNNVMTNNPLTGDYLTNGLDGLSSSLSEYPLETVRVNFQAQALLLTDLKSVTLHTLVEQLGLAEPERFTWTLAERTLQPGTTCPIGELYLVIQRNFDITTTPLNQIQYSPYVNGTLYSYTISEFCSGTPPLAFTVPFNVDPFANIYTSVAANNADGLGIGGFYTGLTRDDVAGLRYLLTTNNIATENAGSGSLLLVTNNLPQQIITTQPLASLLNAAATVDPATLQALFPGLIIASVSSNNISSVVATNVVVTYFFGTNTMISLTNSINSPGQLDALVNLLYQAGVTNISAFATRLTNSSVWVTNYAGSEIQTSQDLGLLLARAATNDPATLIGFYPELFVSTVTNFGVGITTNITAFYTNFPGATVTNFLPTLSTNATSDLGLLLARAATNDPATLIGFYPGLIVSTVTNVGVVIGTNIAAFYTNFPGATVTNFLPTFSTNGTSDLGLLLARAATNDPATLIGFYPGLIVSTVTNVGVVIGTNIAAFYTNFPGPNVTNFLPTFSTNGTSDLGLLLARAATNDPATLIGFYPGLIVSTVTNVGVVIGTNITAFYTNFPGPNVTNFLPTFSTNGTSDLGLLLARAATNDPATLIGFYPGLIVSTVTNVGVVIGTNITAFYTNFPGPNVTNFLPTFSTNGTSDLGLLLARAATNDPATLIGFYPGLIVSTVTNVGVVIGTNITAFYTNFPGPNVTNFLPTFSTNGTSDLGLLLARAATNDPATLIGFYPGLIVSTVTNVGVVIGTNITAFYTNFPGPNVTNFLPTFSTNGTSDLGLLLARAATNDPATLIGFYPGLIVSTVTNVGVVIGTNITAFYTNFPGATVTNFLQTLSTNATSDLGLLISRLTNDPATLQALYPGLLVSTVTNQSIVITTNLIAFYTNQPGPSITNQGTPIQLLPPPLNNQGTLDFNLFTLRALTNTAPDAATAIAQLQAFYPGLVVLSANLYFTNVVTTNFVTSLIVPIGSPVGSPPIQVTTVSSIRTNLEPRFTYKFGNIMLNVNNQFYPFVGYTASQSLYATGGPVTVQTISVTNLVGSPVGTPLATNITTSKVRVRGAFGNFFIMPTNWCGFTIVAAPIITVLPSFTTTITATGTTNASGAAQLTQNTIYTYTNYIEQIRPGVCEPQLQFTKSYTTNVVLTYQNTLLNVFTNYYAPTSTVKVITTNVFTIDGAVVGTLYTNVSKTNLVVNQPTGDFLILPTNWCGFQILATQLSRVIYTTNTTVAATAPIISSPGGPPTGQFESFSHTVISHYTNHNFLLQIGVCEPVLQFTTNYTTNVVLTYQNTFLNVYTNYYAPTSTVTVLETNVFTTNGAPVGTTVTNISQTILVTNIPTGDFFILPTNWCGSTVITNLATIVVYNTNTLFNLSTPLLTSNGVPTSQLLSYTKQVISHYTNNIFLIHEGVCEPVLQFTTNYTTSVVLTYQNTLLNVFTNYYAPTSTMTVLETNVFTTNGAPVGTTVTNISQTILVTNIPTGDFFILPTNWCGSTVITNLATIVVYNTNTLFNLSTPLLTSNGVPTPQLLSYTKQVISHFTNNIFLIHEGVCEPILQFTTNYTTNVVLTYQNTLLNVFTNYYAPTSTVTVLETNVFTTNGAPVGTTVTNISQTILVTNIPTGDFFIIPTNWCGSTVISNLVTIVAYNTNTLFNLSTPLLTSNGVPTPQLLSYTKQVISHFTNNIFLIHEGVCEPILQFTTNYTTNVVLTYQNTLLNVFTNYYAPTSTVTVAVTNVFTTNGALVGTTVTNASVVNLVTNIPTGDFFIIPTNWCGSTVLSNLVTIVVYNTNTIFNLSTPLLTSNGVPLPQLLSYTKQVISHFTNNIFLLQQGVCEPVLQFTTNYTTNVVLTYQNTLLNVFTNYYAPTSTVTVAVTNVFTTNGAPVGTTVTNASVVNLVTNIPTGDFFIIPTNWCGSTVLSNLVTSVVYSTNTLFNLSTPLLTSNGVPTPQLLSYTKQVISHFTNNIFLLQQGVCEPILQFTTNYTTNVVLTYQNTLLNVFTNYYAPTSTVTVAVTNVFTTNGAPVGTTVTNASVVNLVTNIPTGDFFIIPTNWCGSTVLSNLVTSVVYSTNTLFNLSTPLLTSNGVPLPQLLSYTKQVISHFTNNIFLLQQGVCEPVLQFTTNYTTNVVLTYQNTLLNVFTNYYAPTSTVTVVVTNVFTTNGAPVGTTVTNASVVNLVTNIPTGAFFIIPTNWCGSTVLSNLVTSVVYSTNTIFNLSTPLLTSNGVPLPQLLSYTKQVISHYTNNILLINQGVCEPVLQFTTNYTTNVVLTYQNTLLNVFTNFYSPVSTVTVAVTNVFTTNGAPVGTTVTNISQPTLVTNIPTGDFFIVPTNWCGSTVLGTLLTNVVYSTNTIFNLSTPLLTSNGVPLPQQLSYSQTVISRFTNVFFVIRQGVCEPILQFTTNYTTNVITKYQNTLLNVFTNYYAPTSTVTVLETNVFTTNGAPVGATVTNSSVVNLVTNIPTGDFFIIPTNWCGFTIKQMFLTNVVYTTNAIFNLTTPLLTSNGVPLAQLLSYTRSVISQFTNRIYLIQPGYCVPTLLFETNITTTIVTNFTYTFGNVYTNFIGTNTGTFVITNIYTTNGGTVGIMTTNSAATNFATVTGDFFLIPADWCSFTILSTFASSSITVSNTSAIGGDFILTVSNTFITGNQTNVSGASLTNAYRFSETTTTTYSNHIFLIQPKSCDQVVDTPHLRQGIEKVQFVRANFDSLLGQFFQPVTNFYTMTIVSNSQLFTEFFTRVRTAPDILLTAANNIGGNTFNGTVTRNINFDQGNIGPGLAGPGVINSATTISYNKVGDAFENGFDFLGLLGTNGFVSQFSQMPVLQWASFDDSTNDPVLYPNGASTQNLINQALIQVTPPPPTLPNGATNAAYSVTFTATGGAFSPPYTWTASTPLPPGLNLSTANSQGDLTGMPTQTGTFDFTIQMTDTLGRSVHWNYTIIIP